MGRICMIGAGRSRNVWVKIIIHSKIIILYDGRPAARGVGGMLSAGQRQVDQDEDRGGRTGGRDRGVKEGRRERGGPRQKRMRRRGGDGHGDGRESGRREKGRRGIRRFPREKASNFGATDVLTSFLQGKPTNSKVPKGKSFKFWSYRRSDDVFERETHKFEGSQGKKLQILELQTF
jgi:hypothetical protein